MSVSRLETLPTETLCFISELLVPWQVKYLSCASKRLREVCLPFLFRCVKFEFSESRFDGLRSLLISDARYHVVSLTYWVPELLKPEILDFNCFKSNLLTPNDYVETAKELYDAGGEADECPSYMVIYETLQSACKEQRNIVDNGVDLSVLSSAFGALPRLTDVGLSFRDAIEEGEWLMSSFASDMTSTEESYEYHMRVVFDALQSARNRGIAVHNITLSHFNLPYYHTWEVPDWSTLSESLTKLLKSVDVLRLIDSSSPLELLSNCALDLHRLDMCGLVTEYNVLKDFVDTNKKSIRSIGFHNVKISGQDQSGGRLSELSSSKLCQMLQVPQSTPCRADDCGCLLYRKEGWRLFLHNHHL